MLSAEFVAAEVTPEVHYCHRQYLDKIPDGYCGLGGTGEEWRLTFTTRADRYADLEAHLREQHPWQNPEIIAVPIVAGAAACLEWISNSTEPESTA